jgi:hypothetical protein
MNKGQRYFAEEGHRSKSGKTVVRISKGGRKYYHNPTKYREIKEEKIQKIIEEGGEAPSNGYEHINQRTKSICYDEKSPAYMRYYYKKEEIRNGYPKWVFMSREQHRDYFTKIWDLMMYGEDFQQWLRVDSKTLEEKRSDEWWEERKRKDLDYDGRGDEY